MKPALATAVLGAALAAAGCGGSGSSDTTAQSPRPAAATTASRSPQLPAGRIVFRRFLDAQQSTGALFVINPDGTGERQVTRPPEGDVDDQPDWSPDGRLIAFERCPSDENKPCGVWTVRPDGTALARVTVHCTLRPICDSSSASWLPDSERLIVGLAQGRVHVNGSADQIQRFSVDLIDPARGTQRTIIARDHWTGDTAQPVMSPDGKTVVYKRLNSWTNKPSEGQALYAVGTDGKGNRQLTPWSLGAGDHPTFSPDGKTVLFRSYEEDETRQSNYWTVSPDGGDLAQLTHYKSGQTVLSASYSSDGKWIAVASAGVAGQPDIFAVRADGTGPVQVTKNKAWDSAPDWGPPGS